MIYKTIFQLLLYLAIVFFSFWAFNHIYPWLGFLIFFSLLIYLVIKFYNYSKKEIK